MCCATPAVTVALDAAPVGVFGFVGQDGRPRACPVTPYMNVDEALISSTLAFTAKIAAVRRHPQVALLAGGCLVQGPAVVDIDLSSRTFDEQVRAQEIRKYPPSRQLLAIPGHRRWLWWYVGRATVRIPLSHCSAVSGSDRVTLTVLENGSPQIMPLGAIDVGANEVPIATGWDGPGCVLVHDEDQQMADLRQLALHGIAHNGIFRVERRTGSLTPTRPSTLDQLRTLHSLSRQARRKRPVFEQWAEGRVTIDPGSPAPQRPC